MKYQGITFPLFAVLAFVVVFLNSSNTGGRLTGACNSCHGSNTSANGSIILTGLPNSGAVALNTTYSMQLCIVDPGKVGAGFRVETDLGAFIAGEDGSSQINAESDRITHTFPKPFGSPGNPACWDFDWTSPASGSVEPSFTLRGNAVNGNSSATGDNGGYIEVTQGLPVEFATFTLLMDDENIDIHWVTASEINNDRFIIQRSLDNVRYTNIATVKGNDNSLEMISYNYEDKAAPKGTLYYRILQIDHDGTKDYSTTKVIENTNDSSKWLAYPNPIDLNVTSIINVENASTDLTLFDHQGRIVNTYLNESQDGFIDLGNHLKSGIYYLSDGDQTVSISVLR